MLSMLKCAEQMLDNKRRLCVSFVAFLKQSKKSLTYT